MQSIRPPRSTKAELRRALRLKRRACAGDERVGWSREIARLAAGIPEFSVAVGVGIYRAIHHEVDPAPLENAALERGKRLFLPVVREGDPKMIFARRGPETVLTRGPFGIWQPDSPSPGDLTGPDGLDLLFLPLLGFDGRGFRLGYGGGYYDRFLAGRPAGKPFLVGLAFGFQQVTSVFAEPHDVPLDLVVTERGVTRFAAQTAP